MSTAAPAHSFNLYVVTVELGGTVGHLEVTGGIAADGARSDAVHVRGDVPGLDTVTLSAADGEKRVAV